MQSSSRQRGSERHGEEGGRTRLGLAPRHGVARGRIAPPALDLRRWRRLLFAGALTLAPGLSVGDDPGYWTTNEPFRFPQLDPMGERRDGLPGETGSRTNRAMALETGEVVELCRVDTTSDPCASAVRSLVEEHPARDVCSVQQWARKFVARALRSSEFLVYWRGGSALILMTIVMDEAEFRDGFSCEG